MQSDQVSMKISSKKILPAKIGTLHATVATIVRAFRNFDMIRCILSPTVYALMGERIILHFE